MREHAKELLVKLLKPTILIFLQTRHASAPEVLLLSMIRQQQGSKGFPDLCGHWFHFGREAETGQKWRIST